MQLTGAIPSNLRLFGKRILRVLATKFKNKVEPPDSPGVRALHACVLKTLARYPDYPIDEVTDLLLRHKQKHKLSLVNLDALETNAKLSLQNRFQNTVMTDIPHESSSELVSQRDIALEGEAITVYQAIAAKRGITL